MQNKARKQHLRIGEDRLGQSCLHLWKVWLWEAYDTAVFPEKDTICHCDAAFRLVDASLERFCWFVVDVSHVVLLVFVVWAVVILRSCFLLPSVIKVFVLFFVFLMFWFGRLCATSGVRHSMLVLLVFMLLLFLPLCYLLLILSFSSFSCFLALFWRDLCSCCLWLALRRCS